MTFYTMQKVMPSPNSVNAAIKQQHTSTTKWVSDHIACTELLNSDIFQIQFQDLLQLQLMSYDVYGMIFQTAKIPAVAGPCFFRYFC